MLGRHSLTLVALAALAAAASLGACHRHHGKVLVSQEVGADGAHIEGPGVTIDIPAGALSGPETVLLALGDDDDMPTPPLSEVYVLEPEGLTFEKPIRLTIDVPGKGTGVVMWSRPDGDGFEFAGFAADGVAVAENTHFSTIGVTDGVCPESDDEQTCEGCEAQGEGEVQCPPCPVNAACGGKKERCRSLCYCKPPDETGYGFVCPKKPEAYGNLCVADPALPTTDSRRFLGTRNGEACTGYVWEALKETMCQCVVDTPNPGPAEEALCPVPWTQGAGGTWGCTTTPAWGYGFEEEPEAQAPPPDGPDHPEYQDPKYSGYGITAYVKAGWEGEACFGHWRDDRNGGTKDGGELSGKLASCNASPTELDYHWVDLTGTAVMCDGFEWPSGMTPVAMTDDEKARCKLTAAEWDKLEDRRAKCGMPPFGSLDTLSILTVGGEPSGALSELTGISSDIRPQRPPNGGDCPPQVPITHDYKGIGTMRFDKKGQLYPDNVTAGHAEGNALLQLAEQRGRTPPAGDGTPGSDWGAEGGRTGGCGEMIVDRKPCSYACAKEGISVARLTAGLEFMVVRSPAGCMCFGPGIGDRAGKCRSEALSCADYKGPESVGDLCTKTQ